MNNRFSGLFHKRNPAQRRTEAESFSEQSFLRRRKKIGRIAKLA
jgi:hypothetical protein